MVIFPYRGWLRNPSPVGRGFNSFFVLPTGDLGLASTLPPVMDYRNTICIKNIKEPYSKHLPHLHRCMTKSIEIRSLKRPQKSDHTGAFSPFFAIFSPCFAIFRNFSPLAEVSMTRRTRVWSPSASWDDFSWIACRRPRRARPGGPETLIWPLRIRRNYGKSIIFDV